MSDLTPINIFESRHLKLAEWFPNRVMFSFIPQYEYIFGMEQYCTDRMGTGVLQHFGYKRCDDPMWMWTGTYQRGRVLTFEFKHKIHMVEFILAHKGKPMRKGA